MIYNKEEKMNGLEALKELKENAQEVCKWELDRLNIIEKDLEMLEILKKHCDFSSPLSMNYFIEFFIYNSDEEFEKVKEWLLK